MKTRTILSVPTWHQRTNDPRTTAEAHQYARAQRTTRAFTQAALVGVEQWCVPTLVKHTAFGTIMCVGGNLIHIG